MLDFRGTENRKIFENWSKWKTPPADIRFAGVHNLINDKNEYPLRKKDEGRKQSRRIDITSNLHLENNNFINFSPLFSKPFDLATRAENFFEMEKSHPSSPHPKKKAK